MRTIAILLIALLTTACTTAQLDLPTGAWTVEGSNPRWWNQPISFGPYRTEAVDEGTTRSWLADLNVLQIAKADQGYHLRVGDVSVECHTRELLLGRSGGFVDPAFGGTPLLVCGYDDGGSRSALTLARTGRPEPALQGPLRAASGAALEVRSLHRSPGAAIASAEPWGFEILRDGSRVAVVETINRGRVWIDPAAEDRDVLAAVAASLLLFRDPDAGE